MSLRVPLLRYPGKQCTSKTSTSFLLCAAHHWGRRVRKQGRHVFSSSPLLAKQRKYSGLATLTDPPSSSRHVNSSTSSWPLPVPSDAQRQTIYALATPPGKGGVAIIRVSGPEALAVFRRIARPAKSRAGQVSGGKGKEKEEPSPSWKLEPGKMVRCTIVDPGSGEELDDGLAVFFKGKKNISFYTFLCLIP